MCGEGCFRVVGKYKLIFSTGLPKVLGEMTEEEAKEFARSEAGRHPREKLDLVKVTKERGGEVVDYRQEEKL